MRGRGGRGRGAPKDRKKSRPAGAKAVAAESAQRVSTWLGRVLGAGARVAEVAEILGVRAIDVARWRRGQPIASYRRADLEAKISRLVIVVDPDTGERRLEIGPAPTP